MEGQVQEIFRKHCVWDENLGVNILREPGPESVRLLLDPVIKQYTNSSTDGTRITSESAHAIYVQQSWDEHKSLIYEDFVFLMSMLLSNTASAVDNDKGSDQGIQQCTANSSSCDEPPVCAHNISVQEVVAVPPEKKPRLLNQSTSLSNLVTIIAVRKNKKISSCATLRTLRRQ